MGRQASASPSATQPVPVLVLEALGVQLLRCASAACLGSFSTTRHGFPRARNRRGQGGGGGGGGAKESGREKGGGA